MIESLNDDCQLLIIDHLELKDQLTLWEATAHIASSRINNNVIYSWQHKLGFVLDKETLHQLEVHPKQLEAFLCSISGTVQQLKLQYITLYELQRWIGHSFSRMRELCFTLDDNCELVADLALELLVELFPKLSSLKPCGSYNSKLIEKWPQLQRLDLTDCWCPPVECVSLGQFQQLEEVVIHSGFISNQCIDSIIALPNLRTFCFHAGEKSEEVLSRIIDQRAAQIKRASFNDSIWYCTQESLQRMKNMRQLTLIEDDGLQAAELETLLASLPLLERLDLINFQIWRSEIELWQTVGKSDSLKVLNISGMQLYEDFFEFSRRYMENVLSRRSNPLRLHCHDTGQCNQQIAECFKNSNLLLKWEPLNDDDYIEIGCIKVEFSPPGQELNN